MLNSVGGAVLLTLFGTLASADSISNGSSKTSGDMCSWLSVTEVEQALGGKIQKPTLLPSQATSPGGCSYMALARGASITMMVFEPPDAPDFFASMVHGTTEANHFTEEPVPGLGTKAVHVPSNFFVLSGKKVLMFTYGGAPRAKVEGLVRKLVSKL